MKYIIGFTSYTYEINGIIIPGKVGSRENQVGESGIATVSPEQLNMLEKNNTFKRLIESKSIKVLDTKPSWAVSSAEKMQEKDAEIAALKKELEKKKVGDK